MDIVIRPFEDNDYEVLTEVINLVYPEYPTTADELRREDSQREEKCIFRRFILELDGSVVATANYDQHIWSYNPQYFDLSVNVIPEFRRQGLGAALYNHLVQELSPHKPRKFRAFTREDFGDSLSFAKSRGYKETMKTWESRLDLQSFDLESWDEEIKRVEESGVVLKRLTEIPRDEARDRALHEFENRLGADVPGPDPFTPITYEFFVKRVLENPRLFQDAFILAMADDKFIGMSALWKSEGNQDLYTGLTGVDGGYRRRGIALAMKLKSFEAAKRDGHPIIKTWNEQNNRGMLSINERLGFVKQPPWLNFEKELDREG